MSLAARFKSWAVTPGGLTACAIVLMTGVLLGFHAWWSFADPVPRTYYADFSGAQWIEARGAKDVSYFRKKFYLTGPPIQAYVALAANDYYEAAINGVPLTLPDQSQKITPLMTASFISTAPETQFDITPFLVPGENVLTVYVRHRILDHPPVLLAKGFVQESTNSQYIYSDSSWKAKPVPDDLPGNGVWAMPGIKDDAWPDAQIIPESQTLACLQPVSIPPAVFNHPISGSWLGTANTATPQAYFRRTFSVPWGTRETWLEASSPANYSVYLNGRLVTSSRLVQLTLSAWSNLKLLNVPTTYNSAVLVNLNPFLHWGSNQLEIRTENSPTDNVFLGEILFLDGNGGVQALHSDTQWQAHGLEPAGPAGAWKPARDLGPYGTQPYGNVSKLGFVPDLPTGEQARMAISGFILAGTIFTLWILIWVRFSAALSERLAISYEQALTLDALAQLPIILVLTLIWLSFLDVRFRPDWGYHPAIFFLVIFLSVITRALLWARSPVAVQTPPPDRTSRFRELFGKYGFGVSLVAIVIIGFIFRVSGLMTFPLDHDEIFIRNCVHGILERGYPSTENSSGILYRLTTYELIPWPEFVCAVLGGFHSWTFRVPSLIFGTLVAGVLGIFGARLFDRRVGLLAALLYAFISWDVHWARHCFHLQQTQFMALLCFFAFYRAIRDGGGVDRNYYILSCVLFCCTYLSWEGSGFILPAFAVVLIAMHPTDWRWARQFHFWAGLVVVACIVLMQLSDRAMTLPPYLGLGSGLSDISSPSLFFLDPNSQTNFYFAHVLSTEPHILLSIFFFLGLPLCFIHKPTRYIMVLFGSLFACYSALLPIESIRYFYFYQTLLILGGCAVAIQYFDRVVALARSTSTSLYWPGRWARWSFLALILLVFLAAGQIGMKIYRVTFTSSPEFFFRPDDGYVDYQQPSLYVKDHLKPGDVVISVSPHTYAYFTGTPCLSSNSLLVKRMYHSQTLNPPAFVDRYSGTASIVTLGELQQLYAQHKRVWYLASPALIFQTTIDADSRAFIQNMSELVFESADTQVYLCDGYGGSKNTQTNNLPVVPGANGATSNNAQTASLGSTSSSSTTTTTTSGQTTARNRNGGVMTPMNSPVLANTLYSSTPGLNANTRRSGTLINPGIPIPYGPGTGLPGGGNTYGGQGSALFGGNQRYSMGGNAPVTAVAPSSTAGTTGVYIAPTGIAGAGNPGGAIGAMGTGGANSPGSPNMMGPTDNPVRTINAGYGTNP
jgi:hypothetical protein